MPEAYTCQGRCDAARVGGDIRHLPQNLGHFGPHGSAMAPLADPLDQPLPCMTVEDASCAGVQRKGGTKGNKERENPMIGHYSLVIYSQ